MKNQNLKLIVNKRPLETFGKDINIYAKGLCRPFRYELLNNLPKQKTRKLYLVKG
jgi:hypothetical protein